MDKLDICLSAGKLTGVGMKEQLIEFELPYLKLRKLIFYISQSFMLLYEQQIKKVDDLKLLKYQPPFIRGLNSS